MGHLQINVLGALEVVHNERRLASLRYAKLAALLAYLAVEHEQPHQRVKLAAFLWPGQPRPTDNLRSAIASLRRALAAEVASTRVPEIVSEGNHIQLQLDASCSTDLDQFQQLLRACHTHKHRRIDMCRACARRLDSALALYRGEFLAGLDLPDSAGFAEWLALNRTARQQEIRHICELLTRSAIQSDHFKRAEIYCLRWIELDPFDPEAHRSLMRLYAYQDEPSRALAHYETWRETLQTELGLEPEPVTQELYESIRAGTPGPYKVSPPVILPHYPTRFFGRETELEWLAERLEDRSCPLITLIGVGGVGKTRLAVEAATINAPLFIDGVFFVACAGVQHPDFLVQTIAQAVGCAFEGARNPKQLLRQYLSERAMLLIIDNIEQVLDGAGMLAELVAGAPDIALLVTSREQPDLPDAKVLRVTGLATTDAGEPNAMSQSAAVHLFLDRARQNQLQFAIQPEELPVIHYICRHMEGMPLGIELAAGWVRYLSCTDIAAELAQNLDLLSATVSGGERRHQSMRLVLEQSWRMLKPAEQDALSTLALFRGGFSFEAAAAVAGASREQLDVFASKLWIRQHDTGRYTMHELLRQYAEEQLQATGAYAERRQAHFAYFRAFFDRADRGLRSAEQMAWIFAVDAEIDNIRAALTWSLDMPAELEAGMWIFGNMLWFIYFRNYWSESFYWSGRFLKHPEAHQYPHARAKVLLLSGGLYWLQGQNDRARNYLTESLQVHQSYQDTPGSAYAATILGYTLQAVGDVEQARHHLNAAITVFRAIGDQWGLSLALVSLSEIELAQGDLEQTQQCIDQAFEHVGVVNPIGAVYIVCLRGKVAYLRGELSSAAATLQEALTQSRSFGVKRYAATAHLYLGRVALARGDTRDAHQQLLDAYRLMLDLAERPAIAECLEALAQLAVCNGQAETGARYIGLACQIRDSTGVSVTPVDQVHCENVLQSVQAQLSPEHFRSLIAIGRLINPEHLLPELERIGDTNSDA